MRLLKRAIAREVFKSLTRGLVAPELADLRPARQAKNITLRAAAKAMNRDAARVTATHFCAGVRGVTRAPDPARGDKYTPGRSRRYISPTLRTG